MVIMKFNLLENTGLTRFVNGEGARGKLVKLLFASLASILMLPQAHADCTKKLTFADTVINFPATISVPPNVAPNTVIATVTVPVSGANSSSGAYATCTGSTSTVYWQIAAGPVVANRIGPTSVAGIGYTATFSGGTFASPLTLDSSPTIGVANPVFTNQVNVTVNLVTTGAAIGSGPLTLNPATGTTSVPRVSGSVAGRAATYFAFNAPIFNVAVASNATTIASSACSVTTPSPSVTLSPVKVSALTGVGSTAANAPISLGLNCTSDASRVFVTLTDSSTPSNVSNTLSLKAGSTASGVALQILDPSGNPISFGPDSAALGNTNQWLVGPATVGPMNIPLTVRYLQTAATVKPGTVNGVATFTMSYQ
jgi:type 1 fimbria pilin